MSECVGKGCTYPGCSGQHAGQVNAYARAQNPAAQVQAALAARQAAEAVALQPNRADRRRAARRARRSG